jgi:hypothetical protein
MYIHHMQDDQALRADIGLARKQYRDHEETGNMKSVWEYQNQ